MKLWIDDIRPAPEGYIWAKSVNEAQGRILRFLGSLKLTCLAPAEKQLLIDLDHDAGDYSRLGGDYIKLLDWLEQADFGEGQIGKLFTYHIHSQNPVGVENMRRIIKRNGWKEV